MRFLVLLIVTLSITSSIAIAEPCIEPQGLSVWTSPAVPSAGATIKILVVSESPIEGKLFIVEGKKGAELLNAQRRNGPPFSLASEFQSLKSGMTRIELRQANRVIACRRFTVTSHAKAPLRPESDGAWKTTRAWTRASENFFSAWIEMLFDAPVETNLSFPSLAPVIRDPERNFLFGYLGLREDDPKNRAIAKATPDCADLPYYLRAYFSWKLGLPFSLRDCDRGKSDRPPRCGPILHNEQPINGTDRLARFRAFLSLLANRAHSGSARTALADDETDFYPVALTRRDLRPGTIFADPYGHVLMVAKWVQQDVKQSGLLLAVDGQPDNSVGRKRFWEGTFLFTNSSLAAGPGFKAFRPVERHSDGSFIPLTNRALANDMRFATFSDEQARLNPEVFYARMAKIIHPKGLDAQAAYRETMNALVEQLITRIGSVDNGERYMRETNYQVVPMPTGPKIFETIGPWEDYATPSRDMRLLIALRVLSSLPDRIEAHPELFLLSGRKPSEVKRDILTLHQREISARGIDYQRSDGSMFHLTVADILARREALGQAYNPNDCAEIRWGATPGTPDYPTCRRHAPEEQRQLMKTYLPWFLETRRPPR